MLRERPLERVLAAGQVLELVQQLADVGRGRPQQALTVLSEALSAEIAQLQALAAGGGDPSVCLERATLLLATLSASLADPCDGEVPLLPVALQAMVEEAGPSGESGRTALVGASQVLLRSVSVFLDPAARQVVSPRFGEVAARALARWLDTFLFSEDAVPQVAVRRLNTEIDQAGTLDMSINLAGAALTQWAGEFELHRVACQSLVDAVVHDLVDHVVQAGAVIGVADVHTGTLTNSLKAFENLDGFSVVFRGGEREVLGGFAHDFSSMQRRSLTRAHAHVKMEVATSAD